MYDLIVIGGGPAGLTATMYAIRKRLNVLMVTEDIGGKTNYDLKLPWVEDYQVIQGRETVKKFATELEYLDFAYHKDSAEKVEKIDDGFSVTTSAGEKFETKALVIATGAKQKLLRVPGEKEFMMSGLCFSALSYAPLFIDKEVVVVGDCGLALRSAGELATVASKVHLVGVCDDVMQTPLGEKLSAAENVKVYNSYEVLEFQGDQFAERVILQSPEGEKVEIKADGFFVELGLSPNAIMVEHLVEQDEEGRIVVDHLTRTSMPGVFAAGDVTNIEGEQVLIAVGEGAKAALNAYEYLLPLI
jgi:alkyl hydroperoxide reductase subunit F